VIEAGLTEQVEGGAVLPETQVRFTLFKYPLRAKIVPEYVAVWPTKTVCGLFPMVI
jgi:hypothetical protein